MNAVSKLPSGKLLLWLLMTAFFSLTLPFASQRAEAAASGSSAWDINDGNPVVLGKTYHYDVTIVNSSTAPNTGDTVTLTSITGYPACDDAELTNPPCTTASNQNPGVFSPVGNGTGGAGTACDGENFTITVDAAGVWTFTPDNPVVLGASVPGGILATCSIIGDLSVDALPDDAVSPFGDPAGIQTVQVSRAQGANSPSGLLFLGQGSAVITVTNPSTDVDASVGVDSVVVGNSVQLTITEANDGDVDLTNAHVDLTGGAIVGTLTLDPSSPDFSGDDGDGILEPTETWQWLVTDTPLADATYTAIGHGTAPTGEDVTWCENPDTPPENTICDQDERAQDSVTVTEDPSITIVKTAGDAPDGTVLQIQPGDAVTFHYLVCNTGDVPLENGVVTDDNGTPGDLTDDFTVVVPGVLASTDPDTCVTVDSDPITIAEPPVCDETRLNVGTVVATSVPLGTEVTDSDDAELCTPPGGEEGCTPGYWKQEQHFDSWTAPYTPETLFESVFSDPNDLIDDDTTLVDALQGGGGPGAEGAAKILARAAVASLLNAASPDVDFTMTTAEVIADVNAALASGDRQTMLDLAGELDADNNLGCPLNGNNGNGNGNGDGSLNRARNRD